jgi:hypothetical protein
MKSFENIFRLLTSAAQDSFLGRRSSAPPLPQDFDLGSVQAELLRDSDGLAVAALEYLRCLHGYLQVYTAMIYASTIRIKNGEPVENRPASVVQ